MAAQELLLSFSTQDRPSDHGFSKVSSKSIINMLLASAAAAAAIGTGIRQDLCTQELVIRLSAQSRSGQAAMPSGKACCLCVAVGCDHLRTAAMDSTGVYSGVLRPLHMNLPGASLNQHNTNR